MGRGTGQGSGQHALSPGPQRLSSSTDLEEVPGEMGRAGGAHASSSSEEMPGQGGGVLGSAGVCWAVRGCAGQGEGVRDTQ